VVGTRTAIGGESETPEGDRHAPLTKPDRVLIEEADHVAGGLPHARSTVC
jgi:hypothetical protein